MFGFLTNWFKRYKPNQSPFKDCLTGKENVHIYLYGPDGKLKAERHKHNLIVTAGENHIADQMSDGGEAAMSHMAIGSGGAAPASGNTALGAELAREALTATQQTGADANTVRYEASYAAGTGTGTIKEAGILNAATAGTLLARVTFSDIGKEASDVLDIDWDITFSDDGA